MWAGPGADVGSRRARSVVAVRDARQQRTIARMSRAADGSRALRENVRCRAGGARGRPCEAARGLQGALARAEGERRLQRPRLSLGFRVER